MNMSIDDKYICSLLDNLKYVTDEQIDATLAKAESFTGLNHEEVAALLTIKKPEHLLKLYEVASKIKEEIYGNRIVMFAPLYISDYCVNKCSYCGFRCDNKFERKKLTLDEIKEEVRILEEMGHKRIALEAGEDPLKCDINYVIDAIKTIYSMKTKNGEIRRVNVNIASTTVENYKKLKDIGIGTYILFQETYHKDTYEKVHISGPKKDFDYHLTAFDRANQAGIDDVGGGVLFGLADPYYEVLALMLHNEHLEKTYGAGFHTISVPRLCSAEGADDSLLNNVIDDELFLKLVAIIRIAVPYTGMIISTRETQEMRKKLIKIGISQVSAGSSVDVGGYSVRENGGSQFEVADARSAPEIIDWLLSENLIPSFCTACYRKGRTGDRFMALAKSGEIKNVCLPNALMTLKEYSQDYGNKEFKDKVEKVIDYSISTIDNSEVQEFTIKSIEAIKEGKRDLYL